MQSFESGEEARIIGEEIEMLGVFADGGEVVKELPINSCFRGDSRGISRFVVFGSCG